MMSDFLNPSPSPKTTYFYVWRHQDTSKKPRKSLERVETKLFIKVEFVETRKLDMFRKDGHRKRMKIRQIKSRKNGYVFHTYQNHEIEIW